MTEPTQRLPMASLNGAVESLAFDGGGRRLAAGTQSGLSVWNVADLVRDSTPTVMQVPAGADFRAEHGGMAWAADGSRLYVCGENHTLRAFDAVSGGLLREERAGFDAGIAAICASANPQALFVGLANGGLLRWKPPANPEPVRAVHPDGGPMLLAADPTGHTIVSCGGDCIVRLRSGSDGSERARSEQLPGQPVALAYDGNHVFVAMNEADRSNFRIMGLCRSGGSGLEVFGQLTDAGEVKAITSDQGRFLVAVLEVGGRPIARCWKVEAGEAEPPHHELTLAGPRPSLD
jgi:WD40 repeat protein